VYRVDVRADSCRPATQRASRRGITAEIVVLLADVQDQTLGHHDVNAGADRPADEGLVEAGAELDAGRNERRAVVDVRESNSTIDVEKHTVRGMGEPAVHGTEAIDLMSAGKGWIGARGAAVDIRNVSFGLDAKQGRARQLEIVADPAADEAAAAVVVSRYAGRGRELPACIGLCVTAPCADITTRP
jgi:hypothetical protein